MRANKYKKVQTTGFAKYELSQCRLPIFSQQPLQNDNLLYKTLQEIILDPRAPKTIIKLRNGWEITKDGYESLGRLFLLYNILEFTTSFLHIDRTTSWGLSTPSGWLDSSCILDNQLATISSSAWYGWTCKISGTWLVNMELANQSHHCHQCNFFDLWFSTWTPVPFWFQLLTS